MIILEIAWINGHEKKHKTSLQTKLVPLFSAKSFRFFRLRVHLRLELFRLWEDLVDFFATARDVV